MPKKTRQTHPAKGRLAKVMPDALLNAGNLIVPKSVESSISRIRSAWMAEHGLIARNILETYGVCLEESSEPHVGRHKIRHNSRFRTMVSVGSILQVDTTSLQTEYLFDLLIVEQSVQDQLQITRAVEVDVIKPELPYEFTVRVNIGSVLCWEQAYRIREGNSRRYLPADEVPDAIRSAVLDALTH